MADLMLLSLGLELTVQQPSIKPLTEKYLD